MAMVLIEENNKYQINCSGAVSATSEIHELYNRLCASILSDVDFFIEEKDKFIFVEYKNSCIKEAANSDAFLPSDDKTIRKIARKFYDSTFYLRLKMKEGTKPLDYVYILEYPKGDSVTRKAIRNKISNYLPFSLQEELSAKTPLIENFQVLSIAEWNEKYQDYPLAPLCPPA